MTPGATDFITKPINWAILHHRLRYMWRSSLVSENLRKSEMKNRALIDALPDLLLRITRDGRILSCGNRAVSTRFFPARDCCLRNQRSIY